MHDGDQAGGSVWRSEAVDKGGRRNTSKPRKENDDMRSLIFKGHFDAGFVKRMLGWHFRFYVRRIGFPVRAGVYINAPVNLPANLSKFRSRPSAMTIWLAGFRNLILGSRTCPALYRSCVRHHQAAFKRGNERGNIIKPTRIATRKNGFILLIFNGLLWLREKNFEPRPSGC